MGVYVSDSDVHVDRIKSIIGCVSARSQFAYLGLRDGDNMSQVDKQKKVADL